MSGPGSGELTWNSCRQAAAFWDGIVNVSIVAKTMSTIMKAAMIMSIAVEALTRLKLRTVVTTAHKLLIATGANCADIDGAEIFALCGECGSAAAAVAELSPLLRLLRPSNRTYTCESLGGLIYTRWTSDSLLQGRLLTRTYA